MLNSNDYQSAIVQVYKLKNNSKIKMLKTNTNIIQTMYFICHLNKNYYTI